MWVRIYHEEESPQIHQEPYVLTNKNNSNSIKNNINSNKNILTHNKNNSNKIITPPTTFLLQKTYGRHSRHAKDLGSASQPSGHFTHGVDVVLGTLPASQKRQVTDGSSLRSWYLPRIQSRQFFVVL